jgi:hypothetical protein
VRCAFDLAHYGELLAAARQGGYRFAFFDRLPEPGDLILRHDVDLSLEAALEMASFEAERDVSATYFLMTEGEFYNLDSGSGAEAVKTFRELGHHVGLHAVWPKVVVDERFDAVFSWHNPDRHFMEETIDSAVNAMHAPFGDWYRSDSNQYWRHGCPHEQLAKGEFERLQLLVHPEIWIFPGDTMRETMLSMLDAKRERLLEQLAKDRIDLS